MIQLEHTLYACACVPKQFPLFESQTDSFVIYKGEHKKTNKAHLTLHILTTMIFQLSEYISLLNSLKLFLFYLL